MTYIHRTLLPISLLIGLWACTPINQASPTPTIIPATPFQTSLPPPTITPTAEPLGCLTQPGRIERKVISETTPPQDYLIYLPPCYDDQSDVEYPVLYLLHGQTYTYDQWVRLGAVSIVDKLILSGEASPLIIVFPDDRYWNVQAGPGFGQRLVDSLVPHIDQQYSTRDDREYRAIGGMSRGAGWALRLGLQRWELFGTLGLHSPAIFGEDRLFVYDWLRSIPPESWPNIFIDSGESDSELGFNTEFENSLSELGIPHEWHLYPGQHNEAYWQAHVEEYLRWYIDILNTGALNQ
ncbi:MAG: alpha/beta hydrolase-fold protein [Anaerolineae bacterium]|nr:alpha/beta hydrolase-fold protein [Anaerolineae bacterium]MDK1079886.1 alpha/beta hydrolase-fold protein [Anaerolineae bacterium]MDK1118185.1 alpha/beta hydrolase-fold protein [Anaerolineae bacterium]